MKRLRQPRPGLADADQHGFVHYVLPLLAMVVVGLAGTIYLRVAHASPPAADSLTNSATVISPLKIKGVFIQSASLAGFNSAAGITANVREGDIAWGGVPSLSDAQSDAVRGATDFIGIEPFFNSKQVAQWNPIINGSQDAYLASLAARLKDIHSATGSPILLALFPEPNGEWNVWDGQLPPQNAPSPAATYVKAYKHIVTVLSDNGVTFGNIQSSSTVTLVWQVSYNTTVFGNSNITLHDFWPGGSNVTYAGVDGFYSSSVTTFSARFGPALSAIRAFTTKPIFIASTGALSSASNQPAQVTSLVNGAKNNGCIGIVYFDLNGYALSSSAAQAYGNAIKAW